MKKVLLTILSIICLGVCVLSSGIMLCMNVSAITENLSRATAVTEKAKFQRDQLVDTAVKTQAYVAGNLDKKDLYQQIETINKEANTQYANVEGIDFAAVDEQYSLDAKCMQHLDDVKDLFANIKIAFCICGIGAIIFLILLFVFCGRSAFGKAIALTGLIVLLLLVLLVVWAIFDFNSMFNFLHSLFFKGGSWMFSESSLIITMYPISFWIAMALICFACSLIISIVLMIVGKIIG